MKKELNMRREIPKKANVPPLEYGAQMATEGRIDTDPQGMWTGVPTDELDNRPIQDVDDL